MQAPPVGASLLAKKALRFEFRLTTPPGAGSLRQVLSTGTFFRAKKRTAPCQGDGPGNSKSVKR